MTAEVQDLFDKFLRIIDTINRYEVEYIVIGGVAMISHGMPRLTQDLGLLLKLTKDNVDKLRNALFSIYNDNEIEEITYVVPGIRPSGKGNPVKPAIRNVAV